MEAQIGLRDDPAVLRDLIHSHWVNAPFFLDARIFFERCPVPIYIITNNGLPYMEKALQSNGLKAEGVISADTVRAYKPHREIFDEALHLGDDFQFRFYQRRRGPSSDVWPANGLRLTRMPCGNSNASRQG